ncbi:MAG: diaminopimelate epimerase, partial [Rickettsiales bacterium]|nr:diaminopimelate epimerase [Rickettsiales bacterium]
MKVKLRRMSGLGNDFLIYDARTQNKLSEIIKNISNLSSRKNKETKGCDQFIIMKSAENADVFMEIYNADGSEVSACGNATRCIGFLISEEISQKIVQIQTKADNLISENLGNNLVSVNMGKPIFEWNKIPLSENFDVFNIPISVEGFEVPSAVSMGNPHLVFFTNVINIDNFEVKKFGEPLESHNFFPQKTNVEFAKIIDRKN